MREEFMEGCEFRWFRLGTGMKGVRKHVRMERSVTSQGRVKRETGAVRMRKKADEGKKGMEKKEEERNLLI